MKYLIVILLLASGMCKAQITFTYCDVYQFEGTDSTNKIIVLKNTYNSKGQIISETYNDYKETSVSMISDASYYYSYQDTLLIQIASFDEEWGDSSKNLYFHNEKHQLIKYQYLSFERQLKTGIEKGFGSRGGCIVTDDDYEEDRTWELTDESILKYDDKGRKIFEYSTLKNSFSASDSSYWEYDDQDRVLKCINFNGKNPHSVQEYTYFEKGYKVKTTIYDSDGNPEYLKKEDDGYYPQYEDIYSLNDKGKITKEISKTEKGNVTSTELTFYNAHGQIERTIYYNENGEPEITHIYIYY